MAAYVLCVIWLVCCVLVGRLAKHKGHSMAAWVVICFLFSYALFFSVLVYDERFPRYSTDGRSVRLDALSDAYAAAFLGPSLPLAVIAFLPNRNRKRCPDCGETVLNSARICKHCRYAFGPPASLAAGERTD